MSPSARPIAEEAASRLSAGRSSLLEADRPPVLRRRPWALRRLSVAILAAAVAAIVWTVATEALPASGLGHALYLAHDALWLPFWSRFWVRSGLWSLLWVAPLSALGTLALLEFLGLGQPLRRLQTLILRSLLRRGWEAPLIRLHKALGADRGGASFFAETIELEALQERVAAMAAAESGATHDMTAAARLTTALARLRPTDSAARIRCAETVELVERLAGDEASAALRAALRGLWPPGRAEAVESLTRIGPEDPPRLAAALEAGALTAEEAALASLGAARLARISGAESAGLWFSHWAQIQFRRAPHAVDLSAAERLIAFEFWAARTEADLSKARASGDRASWLAAFSPGLAARRPLGELAAAGEAPSPMLRGEAR